MTTYQLPLNSPTVRIPSTNIGERPLERSSEDMNQRGKENDGPSLLIVFAYFLGLASIAVVVVAGQFPWFTLAPVTVLLMVAHFRRVEAKFSRKSSSGAET